MLTKVLQSPSISLYKLPSKHEKLNCWVFSTPETRAIVNDSSVLGVDYTDKLQTGIVEFLKAFQLELGNEIKSKRVNVLNFLRGGLNFELRPALNKAFGWNDHGSTFLSSQRSVDKNGHWFVKEDSYHKVTIEKHNIIFCGDVVATGVTVDHGLERLTQIVKERGGSIKRMTFFTIGCHKTEIILAKDDAICSDIFSDFERIDVVYIEGRFHLASPETKTRIKIYGTDLMHRDGILAPELIESQYQNPSYALERCAIYDAGSRAFHISEYLQDVKEYWQHVLEFAEQGTTTEEYLAERAPYLDIKKFKKLPALTEVAKGVLAKLA